MIPALVRNGKFLVSAWSRVIRRERFVPFCEAFRTEEDIEWGIRQQLAVESVSVLPGTPLIYRQRSGSLSNSGLDRKWRIRMDVIRMDVETLEASRADERVREALRQYLGYQYYLLLSEVGMIPDRQTRKWALWDIRDLRPLGRLAVDPKSRFARTAETVLGTRGAALLLGAYRRLLNIYRKV